MSKQKEPTGWEVMQAAHAKARLAQILAVRVMSRYTNLSYQYSWRAEGEIKLSIFIPSDKPYGTHLVESEIIVTNLEDWGLHAKLTRYNREVAASREEGFFFCDGHKCAERIETLDPQDRVPARLYCRDYRAEMIHERLEKDGPFAFLPSGPPVQKVFTDTERRGLGYWSSDAILERRLDKKAREA